MAKRGVDKKWKDLRAALASQDSVELVDLVRDLHDLSQENRDFLNARYLASEDRLGPYKEMIEESLYPDVFSNKPIRISAAKKALSQYTKATNDEAGALELMVYFVERGTRCAADLGIDDETFYSAMESMFERVLKTLRRGSPEVREFFLPRLTAIRDAADGIGWGYHDYLGDALGEAFPSAGENEATAA
jgi:hypothetical protein